MGISLYGTKGHCKYQEILTHQAPGTVLVLSLEGAVTGSEGQQQSLNTAQVSGFPAPFFLTHQTSLICQSRERTQASWLTAPTPLPGKEPRSPGS